MACCVTAPMLTYHHCGPAAIIGWQCHKKIWRYQSAKKWKLNFWNCFQASQGWWVNVCTYTIDSAAAFSDTPWNNMPSSKGIKPTPVIRQIHHCVFGRGLQLYHINDKSTLVQVMVWCRKPTSHYLNQYWPRFLPPYGVARPKWIKHSARVVTLCVISNEYNALSFFLSKIYGVFLHGLLMHELGGSSIKRALTSHFVLAQIFPVEQHVMVTLFLQEKEMMSIA